MVECLSGLEQKNPVNESTYNAASAALGRKGEIHSSADAAVENIGNSTVQYSMDIQVKNQWNYII